MTIPHLIRDDAQWDSKIRRFMKPIDSIRGGTNDFSIGKPLLVNRTKDGFWVAIMEEDISAEGRIQIIFYILY